MYACACVVSTVCYDDDDDDDDDASGLCDGHIWEFICICVQFELSWAAG